MNRIVKDALAITLITVVAGLFLGIVHGVTAGPIAIQEEQAKQEAYESVFADAASFEDVTEEMQEDLQMSIVDDDFTTTTIDEVMKALDASGEQIGYAFTVTNSEGYGGDIQFAIGIKDDGTLNAISILDISETAGLGMRADTDEFKDQFKDKQVESFTYTKSGATEEDEIDALSGSTVTTNAMTNGVNAALAAFRYAEGGNE